MALGRQATRSKSHAAAVEAFSKAIAVAPNNGRAYAERGYAELLAGSLSAATSDLARASHLTSDRQLLAQVAFNQGLVSEETGDTEEARAAFSRSNVLSPSAAARAKMGVGACAGVVEVETPHVSSRPGWLLDGHGGQGVILAKSWQDLVDMTLDEPDAGALTEKKARELFLNGPPAMSNEVSDPPPLRFLVYRNHGSTAGFDMDVVHVRADGSLLVFHSGPLPGRTGAGAIYDCVDETHADAVVDGDVIHATISNSLSTAREGAAIGTEQFDESTDCVDAGRTVEDLFYETRSGRLLLKTTRSSPTATEPSVGLRLERGLVHLAGKGCDQQLSLVRN
jgi:tetratricopeptide (TPR) repeat protein